METTVVRVAEVVVLVEVVEAMTEVVVVHVVVGSTHLVFVTVDRALVAYSTLDDAVLVSVSRVKDASALTVGFAVP